LAPDIEIAFIYPTKLATEYPGVIILGEAGAGKSALISYQCLKRLQMRKPKLPVFIDAKDIQNHSISEFFDEALRAFKSKINNKAQGFVKNCLFI
jgi:chromosomal replication initiation ATPase DnaA